MPFLFLFNWGMPDITGDIMSFRTRHFSWVFLYGQFWRKIGRLRAFKRPFHDILLAMSITWRGDPGSE